MKYNPSQTVNPLNAELNPICHLLALLGAHHILHVSRVKVNNPSEDKIPSACYKTQWNPPLTLGLRTHIQLIYINVHTYPQGSEMIIYQIGFQTCLPLW